MISHSLNPHSLQPTVYRIAISGRLPRRWLDHFDGFQTETITTDGHEQTLLTGPIIDQAHLHGLLASIRDLNLPLLAVLCDSLNYQFASTIQEKNHE